MSANVELLVLRFRDLVTTPGDTIKLHRNIASKHGSVWWGWWNKSGEVIPEGVLRELLTAIKSVGSKQIMLFDSGKLEIHYAECIGIDWDHSHSELGSPSTEATPDYYRDRKYLLWFCFKSISESIPDSESELRKYSYVCVDEFFSNKKSRYTPFYGKRVFDAEELRQQDRTIWFLRSVYREDPTHKVSLLQNTQVQPKNFTEQYTSSKSCNLLWISDPHFGAEHAFPSTSNTVANHLAHAIEDAAKDGDIHDFAGILISGDLTWQARKEEYQEFRNFLARMASSPSKLDNYRVAICPGNHDLAFTDSPDDKTAAIHNTPAPAEARFNYEEVYRELFYIQPNQYLSMSRRFLLGGHLPVEVICLNSSLLEQKEGWFQGHGFIGQAQLDNVESELGWDTKFHPDRPRPFRIVVMHHHLLPVTFSESPMGGVQYSVVLDAERLSRWLSRHRVDLLLHGHMHQSFFAKVSRPVDVSRPDDELHTLHVIGLGSTGVKQTHRQDGTQNMFGVLSASRNHVTIRIFTVNPGTEESRKLWEIHIPVAPQMGS